MEPLTELEKLQARMLTPVRPPNRLNPCELCNYKPKGIVINIKRPMSRYGHQNRERIECMDFTNGDHIDICTWCYFRQYH